MTVASAACDGCDALPGLSAAAGRPAGARVVVLDVPAGFWSSCSLFAASDDDAVAFRDCQKRTVLPLCEDVIARVKALRRFREDFVTDASGEGASSGSAAAYSQARSSR